MIHSYRLTGILVGLALLLATPLAWSQQPHAGRLYEQGVNAYFAGHGSAAEAALSEAIVHHPQDPRAYYFRALSLLRQGRPDEARRDLATGAALEARAPQRHAVGAALERVQGDHRLLVERYRRDARRDVALAASAPAQPAIVAPATFVQPAPDAAVIRQHRVVPLEELLRPEGPRAIAVEPAASAPPTPPPSPAKKAPAPAAIAPASPAAPAAPSPPSTPAAPPAPAAANPFADDSASEPAEPAAPESAAPEPAAPESAAPESAAPESAAPESAAPEPAAPATPPQPVPPQPPAPAEPAAPPPADTEENPFGG